MKKALTYRQGMSNADYDTWKHGTSEGRAAKAIQSKARLYEFGASSQIEQQCHWAVTIAASLEGDDNYCTGDVWLAAPDELRKHALQYWA